MKSTRKAPKPKNTKRRTLNFNPKTQNPNIMSLSADEGLLEKARKRGRFPVSGRFYSTISAPNPTPKKREESPAKTAKSTQNTDPAMTPVGNCSKRFASIKNKAAQAKMKPNIKRPTFAVAFTSIYFFTFFTEGCF